MVAGGRSEPRSDLPVALRIVTTDVFAIRSRTSASRCFGVTVRTDTPVV